MASELKPCPFCGRMPTLNHMGSGCYSVDCSNGHHIDTQRSKEAAIERWNTRTAPAATDTGLETVAWRYRDTWEGARKYWKFFERHLDLEDAEIQALCLRSQAEELLAAERAEKEELDAECRVLAKRCIEKDARIKELGDERYKLAYAITGGEDAPGYLDSLSVETLVEVARDNTRRWFAETDRAEANSAEICAIAGHLDCEDDSDSILHAIREIEADKDIYKERAEALEAKLAAAEKALEPFVSLFNEAMKGFTEGYAERTPSDKPVLGWNNAYLLMRDFIEARAVLGGKPS